MKIIKNRIVPFSVGQYLNLLSKVDQQKAASKAFQVFCTPRKGKILPHQMEFLGSAKKEKIVVKKEEIQLYHWHGEGKTVLLVHGWESNSYRWRSLVSDLQKKNYNIISIDAPAHGASAGKTINVFFYAECVQRVIADYKPSYLIGHSIGGMTCIFNHFHYQNKVVEKIVSLGAPSEFQKIMLHYQNLLKLKSPVMQELEVSFQKNFGFKFEEFSAARFVSEFKIPGLIIHNDIDKVVPIESSISIHKNWQNSIFIKTHSLGHSLYSKEVNQAILEFFEN